MATEARTQELVRSFRRDGFVHVPAVLDLDAVARVRERIEAIFAAREREPGFNPRVLVASTLLREEELFSLLFLPRVREALDAVLGRGHVLFPDLGVQRNSFGALPGWHCDADSEGSRAYLCAPDYGFLKCGIYLQENTAEWGGGIDVVPGGHLLPLGKSAPRLNFKLKKAWNALGKKLWPLRVPIRPGDFVAFDSRLPHRSSWPAALASPDLRENHMRNLPRERSKLVVYWDVCAKGSLATFTEHTLKRGLCELEGKTSDFYYADYFRLAYPEAFDPRFVARVAEAGLEVASLDPAAAAEWERRHAEAFARDASRAAGAGHAR